MSSDRARGRVVSARIHWAMRSSRSAILLICTALRRGASGTRTMRRSDKEASVPVMATALVPGYVFSALQSKAKAKARIIAETLFESRTVLLFGEINSELAERVTAELLALSTLGSAPIRLLIHSPGGHVESGDTIHDAIRCIQAPVHAVGTGWVASAGALIY